MSLIIHDSIKPSPFLHSPQILRRLLPPSEMGTLSENLTSLVAQPVKHLTTKHEIQVRSLGWEDPLEKKMATHSSILAWETTVHGVAKNRTRLKRLTFSKNRDEDVENGLMDTVSEVECETN